MFQRLHMPSLGGAIEWLDSAPLGPAELRGYVVRPRERTMHASVLGEGLDDRVALVPSRAPLSCLVPATPRAATKDPHTTSRTCTSSQRNYPVNDNRDDLEHRRLVDAVLPRQRVQLGLVRASAVPLDTSSR